MTIGETFLGWLKANWGADDAFIAREADRLYEAGRNSALEEIATAVGRKGQAAKKRLTDEELARSHDGMCALNLDGEGAKCSCLVHWVAALQKELDSLTKVAATREKIIDEWRAGK
jgi:hypothetical protein